MYSDKVIALKGPEPPSPTGELAHRLRAEATRFTLGACQELRHILILSGVVSPPLRSRIPAMIANGHIDTVVDQELCRFIVPADGALMQNAGRLVRAPVRIYVGSAFQ